MNRTILLLALSACLLSIWSVAHGEESCLVDQRALEDIKKHREEIKTKEENIVKREQEIEAKEKALQEEFTRLKEIRDQINLVETQTDAKLEEQTAKLVETLEKMNPKKAAKILSDVQDRLAVSAMMRLPTDKLAKIMNNVDSERSVKLAQYMTSKDFLRGRQPSSAPTATAPTAAPATEAPKK